tara:strand:- start:329 stop:508 length:180 start_codon:yes stop_codon:yes gene_type:complete
MEKIVKKPLVLKLSNKEECELLIVGLKELPSYIRNSNQFKINSLTGNLQVIKESFDKRY